MSKGPGKWQRLIMAALERDAEVWLVDLVPSTGNRRSQLSALHRAASQLELSGKIGAIIYQYGHEKLLLTHVAATKRLLTSL